MICLRRLAHPLASAGMGPSMSPIAPMMLESSSSCGSSSSARYAIYTSTQVEQTQTHTANEAADNVSVVVIVVVMAAVVVAVMFVVVVVVAGMSVVVIVVVKAAVVVAVVTFVVVVVVAC